MAIEGPLRELGIHDVFQLLDLSRKTGVLRVTSEVRHNAGTIHFEDGTVVYAEIRSNPHPLGSLLLRTGKIAEADLERARDMQQRQGDKRRLGEILVALGAITPRELERQLRFQVEEVIFEVMSWREGYFSFVEGPLLDVPPAATVRIPTEALLMEGARRIDEWSRIESRIPHLGVIAALAPPPSDGGGELDLLPPEWEVLAAVDGQRDVRAIARELGRSEFDVAKTLFGLEISRAAAEQAGSLYPHDPVVHLLLGRAHLAAGRAAEAVDELRRGLTLDPLLAAGHRYLGYALAAIGRFAEAVEQWSRWERLAARSETELAQQGEVRRAKTAAQTLADSGAGFHG